ALRGLVECRSGKTECSLAVRTCDEAIRAELDQERADREPKYKSRFSMLSAVGHSVDPGANPRLAAVLGARALTSDPAAVAKQVNLSYATVMTAVGLARQAEGWADDLSASFGWFQGMARPLLKLAAAEVVAASLDTLVRRLESEQGLSKV